MLFNFIFYAHHPTLVHERLLVPPRLHKTLGGLVLTEMNLLILDCILAMSGKGSAALDHIAYAPWAMSHCFPGGAYALFAPHMDK